ncbi:MAG: ribosome biogenesis factor YjgA [Thiothrix sp.]|uniref:ribosome biogenesis factor YjgA n=1 Tax=Thiothrix sp. TaxID=1032 RepID=UPI002636D7E5|nr:ribosome biogenesis factor YjgA [Thiothrix sp.]MDD5391945.1 ribosome biogenesis factor YjgA [Thiothrix sp.]
MVYEQDQDDDFISKSQIKREAEAAQVIGERLIALRQEQIEQLDLPEKLYDAVMEARRLTSNGAIRRQKQYIGKIMRNVELEPIQTKLDDWDGSNRADAAKFHQLERWRDRVLVDDNAIGELMQEYPALDVQHLRTLIRNARKEQAAGKPPKSNREIFKLLRALAES